MSQSATVIPNAMHAFFWARVHFPSCARSRATYSALPSMFESSGLCR